MQNKNYPKEEVISILKEWASPVLIGIVGMLLWRDVTEMRADVKLLLTQQSADRVKIEQLETDVAMLKQYIFVRERKEEQPEDEPLSYTHHPAIIGRDDNEVMVEPKQKRK